MKPSPIVFTSAPPCCFSSLARDALVLAQHVAALRVAEALHHLRVADDVGEEHGAHAGGCRILTTHRRLDAEKLLYRRGCLGHVAEDRRPFEDDEFTSWYVSGYALHGVTRDELHVAELDDQRRTGELCEHCRRI